LNNEIRLILRDIHFTQRELMSFRVCFFALRATETAQSVAMLSKALTRHLACIAS
jgi:hypothetical protein